MSLFERLLDVHNPGHPDNATSENTGELKFEDVMQVQAYPLQVDFAHCALCFIIKSLIKMKQQHIALLPFIITTTIIIQAVNNININTTYQVQQGPESTEISQVDSDRPSENPSRLKSTYAGYAEST